MRKYQAAALAAVAFAALSGTAEAKGCIKGALVGGLAGHAAGHGVMGAAAGCAVGRHMANRRDASRNAVPAQAVGR